MTQIKFFEYKIKEVGKSWEETQRSGFLETTRKSAMTFASNLAMMLNKEIRVNEKGSQQGHYFTGL